MSAESYSGIVLSTDPRNREGGNPRSNINDDTHKNNDGILDPKPYTFNGKVILGIGVILAAAAASTVIAMGASTSPQIHLSQASSINGASSAALAQEKQAPSQHIDKKFVLIQKDFGWNGTNGGPPIVVSKGDVVQVTVINAGRMAHNFGIAKVSERTLSILNQINNMSLPNRANRIPYDVMAAMPCPDCHSFFQEGHIEFFMQPDTQQVTTFTANEAGNFKYFCQVRGHLWLGMIGDLTVQDVKNPAITAATTTTTTTTTAGGVTRGA
jgi:FtsP/CotA-like multicopper oxidase with cupredoxin domain